MTLQRKIAKHESQNMTLHKKIAKYGPKNIALQRLQTTHL